MRRRDEERRDVLLMSLSNIGNEMASNRFLAVISKVTRMIHDFRSDLLTRTEYVLPPDNR